MPGTMGRKLRRWELAGWVVVGALGPLGHFAYAWSGGSAPVGAFCPVNESVWEHMKLLFFPLGLWLAVEGSTLARAYRNFFAVKCCAILSAVAAVPVLHYTYTGILGRSVSAVDVAIYYVAAAVSALITCRMLPRGRLRGRWKQWAGVLILLALAVIFVVLTFCPPQIALFRDPRTLQYGR